MIRPHRRRASARSAALGFVLVLSPACQKAAPAPTSTDAAVASAAPSSSAPPEAPPPVPLSNGFEGEIDAVVKDAKSASQTFPVTVLVKGDKVRADVPEQLARHGASPMGAPSYVIVDAGAKKLYVVLDPQKQVLFFDLNQAPAMAKSFGASGASAGRSADGGAHSPPPKVAKTGRFETVAGTRCEDWDVVSDHREATVCVANEGASVFSIPFGGAPPESAWMAELLDGRHFPMRVVTYDKDGAAETSRVEVTKIDKKSVPDEGLKVPAGYTQIDLAKMIEGMAGVASGVPAIPHIPHRER
jgi:hypothetical protein